jgi:hypothetical protein
MVGRNLRDPFFEKKEDVRFKRRSQENEAFGPRSTLSLEPNLPGETEDTSVSAAFNCEGADYRL